MWVLGAEASFNFGKLDTGFPVENGINVSFERKHAYGLSLRLGVVLNSWMTYLKLGWENAKFEFSAPSFSDSTHENAIVGGLGMETVIAENIMFGAEATYAHYGTVDFTADGTKFSTEPGVLEAKVRLGYKF